MTGVRVVSLAHTDSISAARNSRVGQQKPVSGAFRLDGWTITPALNRMSRDGQAISLEPRVMAVLVYLAERPGMLVTRQELDTAVWSGMVVSYDALTGAIQKLRKAFGDDPRRPRVIETLSKKGYRLVAPVESLEEPGTGPVRPQPGDGATLSPRRIRAILIFLVLTVLMAGGTAIWLGPWEGQERQAATGETLANSIAVLPFDNLSGDAAQQYFADGMTDDLTTGLAKYPGLLVIARDSAFVYRDAALSLDEVAKKLNVRYILQGSVRREGEQVRINVQLVDAAHGNLLWAETYDSAIDAVFDMQDRVTRDVVSSLAVDPRAEEHRAATYRQTRNPQAYDNFLMGRQYFYLYASRDENLKAREFFESATRYDPDYALAYAMLGWTYTYEAINGWSDDREAALQRGLELAQKAIALDKTLPVAYFVSGFAYRELGEYIPALVEAEKAIEYDPNYANAHLLTATLLYYAGRPEEGLERVRQAMRLNPHHPFNYTFHLGQALFILGRYDEAVAALEEAVSSNPGAERVHVWLAAAYALAGAIDDAQWEAEQIMTMDPDFSIDRIEKIFPFRDPADRGHFTEGLRRAGLR